MRTGPTSDLWWKNAIVYCLDVETYHDADGDGCGDMVGLIERLDHAARLGATCLWLMPFYPTRSIPAWATSATSPTSSATPATGACA